MRPSSKRYTIIAGDSRTYVTVRPDGSDDDGRLKICVMKDGIIHRAVDGPLSLYDKRPTSSWRRFIGSPSMNFVDV